jgi:hypothetical protein
MAQNTDSVRVRRRVAGVQIAVLKKRLMSIVFDEVEGRFFGAAASAV